MNSKKDFLELTFLGRGSAFNPLEGNNSAYFIEDKSLFLIDCGETVFQSLIKNNILNGIEKIYIMITHTHSDHIGSLGTLTSYAYHIMNQKVNIVIPSNPKKERYLNYIENILESTNCKEKYYFIKEKELDNKYKSFNRIIYKETTHSSELDCYGIMFETNKGYIYYSGDTNELNNIKYLIDNNKLIDKIYIDITLKESDNHLDINRLNNEIPNNLKNKIYCMHLDNIETITKAQELGFNIVKIK